MAPELRKRKSVTETQNGNGVKAKVVEKTEKVSKRKAPEDASPVTVKKQKSVTKTAAAPKSKDETTKKPKSKKSKPAETKVVEEEDVVLDVSESSDDEDNAQALALQVDSEDEDATKDKSLFKPGQEVGKVPKVSKDVQKAAKPATGEPGVIYIGRVPHGFYEHEMKQYFSQFGPISKIRLSRNKKTGASKHFAFLEFEEASTAEIVAKTMDNYLLFGHILKCKVVPKEQVHHDLFKGANRRFKKVPWNQMAGQRLAKPLSESAWGTKVSKEQTKREKQAAKLKAIGYDFEAPQIKDVPAPPTIEDVAVEVKAIEPAPETADEQKADGAVEITKTVSVEETPAAEADASVVTSVSTTKTKAPKKAKARKAKA